MSVPEFVKKWSGSTLTERAASQSHFNDLCRVVGHEAPTEADPKGEFFTFEKGAKTSTGGKGWADVWYRGRFAWEYKGPRANLAAAYQQVQKYRENLENPPLLIVCDLNRIEVHTNFTGTAKKVYAFDLADLQANVPTDTCDIPPLEVLRRAFTAPERLRPSRTTAQVTEQAAREFAKLSLSLAQRGHDPEEAAHFLMRLLFCLFAEDIGLLPERLFTRVVENTRFKPEVFGGQVSRLFAEMATGGWFGPDQIQYFNGGLFADDTTLPLTAQDIEVLHAACQLDWSSVEPAIFGTLFERSLDPSKRSQLGAHYTSREDILLIVEPVLMAPLRRRWDEVQQRARELVAERDSATTSGMRTRRQGDLVRLVTGIQEELAGLKILDPACGSGNFLYVALRRLLDLEKEVITFAGDSGMTMPLPQVGPEQLHGLEINPYAHELAQIVVWIGYIQWLHDNGFGIPSDPILKPLDTIRHTDAIITVADDGTVSEPDWPEGDVIIGNPPFLGGKRLRTELGDKYIDNLFKLYDGRVPREADLVLYWFERARGLIEVSRAKRAGLLATNSIRGGPNRRVLQRIKDSGDIFMAWGNRPWVLDGADVRVSVVGFDAGVEKARSLDGMPVTAINADLTSSGADLTTARRLRENLGLAFMGDTKGGAFDIKSDVAGAMLAAPLNPNGQPNSSVVRPWVNGLDIVRRPRGMYIIDFGTTMTEADAALYEAPFQYALEHVKPARAVSRTTRSEWWLHERPRVEMRRAIASLERFVGTARVGRHRIFVWLNDQTLPDSQVIVFARDDDYFFGMLHSRVHELWSLRMCSWLGVGDDPRYTPTTTFETFPFPWTPGQEPQGDPGVAAIAEAARKLHEVRESWLNPPGASAADLAKRTLTNLYNKPPEWLKNLHRALDAAVIAAYDWPATITDDEILERLLALNLSRPSV